MDMIQSLLRVSLLSSVLIGFVLLIRVLWHPRVRVSIIVGLWLVVVLRMLLPFTLHVSVNLFDLVPKHVVSVTEPEVAPETSMNVRNESSSITMDKSPVNSSTVESNEVVTTPKVDTTTPVMSVRTMVDQIDWWMVASIAWLLGAIVVGMRFMVQHGQFRKRIKPSHGTQNTDLQRMVEKHREALGIKRETTVLACAHVHVPVTYGWVKPKILLPVGFEDAMEDDKLNLILLHECCHIKRKDILKSYIWMVCTILHWFNPLVHIAYRAYLDDVEHACDAMVMKYICYEDTYTYSQSLLDVTKQVSMGQPLPLTVSLCKDTSKLKKRVMNMVAPKRKSKWMELFIVLMAVMMMVGCFTTACQPRDKHKVNESVKSDKTDELTIDLLGGARLPELITVEEAMEAVNGYKFDEDEEIKYIDALEYLDDEIIVFANKENRKNDYRILASDLSLISIRRDVDALIPFQKTVEEAESIATKLVALHLGKEFEIISCKRGSDPNSRVFVIKGRVLGIGKEGIHCIVVLNGKGELSSIKLTPPVDLSKGTSKEEAYKKAVQGLKEYYHVVDETKLNLSNYELKTDCYYPQHEFIFSYHTERPTDIEYNYDAMVMVDVVADDGHVCVWKYPHKGNIAYENPMNRLYELQYLINEKLMVREDIHEGDTIEVPTKMTVDDAIKAAEGYKLDEDTTLQYLCAEPFFDDEVVYLEGDSGTIYQILVSNRSLHSLYRNKASWHKERRLSDREAKELAEAYMDQYYALDRVNIHTMEGDGYLFAGYGMKLGKHQKITVIMDGHGELIYIGALPPTNTLYGVSQEEAEVIALEHLKKDFVIEDENVSVLNKRELHELTYCYGFDIVYRTKDHGDGEYDFDATVYVNMANGYIQRKTVIQHPRE